MVTTSWTIVCVDVVKKWWTTMSSSLESDLRELRSLQMATTSLSEDSRSIRYESNQSQAVSTSILAPSYDCNSMAAKTFINDRSRNGRQKGVHKMTSVAKKTDYCWRRAARSSTYHYVAPEPYPKYKQSVYKALKASLGMYDLLALVHLVPAPWDHAFKPPYYPSLPVPITLQFGTVELERDCISAICT
ncbi:uncharacterized protein isoform X1 [Rhodnius prolixus]|uniref:uncharacterized protein isoform X1 n=1 Tax=Rhodnius prolixus TaxID=13249 RepID=UPI003D18C347